MLKPISVWTRDKRWFISCVEEDDGKCETYLCVNSRCIEGEERREFVVLCLKRHSSILFPFLSCFDNLGRKRTMKSLNTFLEEEIIRSSVFSHRACHSYSFPIPYAVSLLHLDCFLCFLLQLTRTVQATCHGRFHCHSSWTENLKSIRESGEPHGRSKNKRSKNGTSRRHERSVPRYNLPKVIWTSPQRIAYTRKKEALMEQLKAKYIKICAHSII